MVVNLCLSGEEAKEVPTNIDLEKSLVQRWVREYHVYSDSSFKKTGISFFNHKF